MRTLWRKGTFCILQRVHVGFKAKNTLNEQKPKTNKEKNNSKTKGARSMNFEHYLFNQDQPHYDCDHEQVERVSQITMQEVGRRPKSLQIVSWNLNCIRIRTNRSNRTRRTLNKKTWARRTYAHTSENRLSDVLDLDIAILKRIHMRHEIETLEEGTQDYNPVPLRLRASEEERQSLQTDHQLECY